MKRSHTKQLVLDQQSGHGTKTPTRIWIQSTIPRDASCNIEPARKVSILKDRIKHGGLPIAWQNGAIHASGEDDEAP